MSSKKYVCNQAKIECQMCTNPNGTLMVTSNMIKLQGKLWATEKDKEKVNLMFQGTCKASPHQSIPCIAVMQTGQWQGTSDVLVQDSKALLESSTIMCNYGGVQIKIKDDMQKSQPSSLVPTAVDGITPDEPVSELVLSSKLENTQTKGALKIKPATDTTCEDPPMVMAIDNIECITKLDKGSDNLGKGKTKDGFIYGKEYEFKIVGYKEDFVPNENEKKQIIWEYSYINDDGDTIATITENAGENYTLKIEDLELCGRDIKVFAYYEDNTTEGVVEQFCHYRFRYFDRSIVETQIQDRIISPELIEQNGTSLCGMASLFYVFASLSQNEYQKYALDLHKKGSITHSNFSTKISNELFEMNPLTDSLYPKNYRGKMPYADWIVLAGTRHSKNSSYTGRKGQDFSAINWPWVMTSIAEDLMGFNTVVSKGCHNPIKPVLYSTGSIEITIKDINKQLRDGNKIILMIDSDMIQDDFSWNPLILEYHWIVLETPISSQYEPTLFGSSKDEVSFKAYSWKSKNKYLTKPITHRHFYENYYGYIKLK
ncbi:DUF4280 domain-containing protein [uncultured Algibacter sp.]|uniref:DUF4280 domain-containing protein n=1 Tax=uncultured Algibacter sp. TaxID=298659 RepID=UPI003217FDF4